jgi:cell division protein FtsZ
VIDDGLSDEVRVTVIATGFDRGRGDAGRSVLFDVERPSRQGEPRERTGPRRRDVVMDEGQRSSLEISDDDIDIPPFLRD